jgi:hypothetical protein
MTERVKSKKGFIPFIKNIFLDAGGVILNEAALEENSARIITGILQGHCKGYTVHNYREDAEEAVYRFVPNVYDYVLYKNLLRYFAYPEIQDDYPITKPDPRYFETGLHKNQEPRVPGEFPGLTVDSLAEISMEAVKAMD